MSPEGDGEKGRIPHSGHADDTFPTYDLQRDDRALLGSSYIDSDRTFKLIGCGNGSSEILKTLTGRDVGSRLECEVYTLTRDIDPQQHIFGNREGTHEENGTSPPDFQHPGLDLKDRIGDAFNRFRKRLAGDRYPDDSRENEDPPSDNPDTEYQEDETGPRGDETGSRGDETGSKWSEDSPYRELERQRQLLRKDAEIVVGDCPNLFMVARLDDANGLAIMEEVGMAFRGKDTVMVDLVVMDTDIGSVEEVEEKSKLLHRLRLIPHILILIPSSETPAAATMIEEVIRGLLDLIHIPGLVNIDLADVKMVGSHGNVALTSLGWGRGEGRSRRAVEAAVSSPSLHMDLAGVKAAVVNVSGPGDMTLEEAESVSKMVLDRINSKARLIWGATVSSSDHGDLGVFIIAGIPPKDILIHCYATH